MEITPTGGVVKNCIGPFPSWGWEMQAGGEGVEFEKKCPNLEIEFLWIQKFIWNKLGYASVKPIYNPHFFTWYLWHLRENVVCGIFFQRWLGREILLSQFVPLLNSRQVIFDENLLGGDFSLVRWLFWQNSFLKVLIQLFFHFNKIWKNSLLENKFIV